MPDYQKGKIYRLVCNITGKQYVGSTTVKLCDRKAGHNTQYKLFLKGKARCMTSFDIVKNGDFSIVLIEEFPSQTIEQLMARERYWIEQTDCLNKQKPTGIPYTDKKEYYSQYRQQNKEKINKSAREYIERDPERRKEQARNYYHRKKAQNLSRIQ